jgi:UrcA family protein
MKNSTALVHNLTREIALGTLLLSGLCAAAAPSFGGTLSGTSSSSKVTLNDLNLATPAGMDEARARIERAAKQACVRMIDLDDLSHHDNFLACVSQALEQSQPALAALAQQSAARVASVTTP